MPRDLRSRPALILASIVLFGIAMGAAAQPASMVKDIDPAPPDPGAQGTDPFFTSSAAVGGELYFDALSGTSGSELWRTDGTPLGTQQVADLCPGACSSSPKPFYARGKVVLFSVGTLLDPFSVQIWRTDGTRAGTYALTPDGLDFIYPSIYSDDQALYFPLCDRPGSLQRHCALWRSDGTRAGTWRIIGPDAGGEILAFHRAGNKLFIVTSDYSLIRGSDLWVSDGTAAGTRKVAVIPFLYRIAPAGDRFLWINSITTQFDELWASDGTPAGTGPLMQFKERDYSYAYLAYQGAGGRAYFPADDGVHGVQVWSTDGTKSGTRRATGFATPLTVSNFSVLNTAGLNGRLLFQAADSHGLYHLFATDGGANPPVELSPAVSHDGPIATAGGRALFFADDGVHGIEPWTTDGTLAGTALVADLCPGPCSTPGTHFFSTPAGAIFWTDAVGYPANFWLTDGTAAGTRKLTDFAPGQAPEIEQFLTGAAGKVFFVARDTAHGGEVWVADGTPAGTHPVGEIGIGEGSSSPARFTTSAGRLFFTACDGTTRDVWVTAGTAATTTAVGGPAAKLGCSDDDYFADHDLTPVGGAVYFLRSSDAGEEVWRTDGTPPGTVQVASAPLQNAPVELAAFQDGVWFALQTTTHAELWRADAAGAQRAVSFADGIDTVRSLSAVAARLLFFAGNVDGVDLFESDGTPGGTQRLAGPFNPYDAGSPPPVPRFVSLGSTSFFVAQSLVDSGGELWKTDGTAAGTALVRRLELYPGLPVVATGQALFFFDAPPAGPPATLALWRTDGTAGGTLPIATFVGSPYPPPKVVAVGDRLYFTADDGVHGVELWTSDGTAAGTRLVIDLFAGPPGSNPHDLTPAGGRLYFGAGDGFHGDELWSTDGTAAGTRLVQDIAPEAASSSPDHLTVAGDRLYFVADDGLHGRELWSLALSGGPAVCAPAPDRLCLSGGRFQVTAEWRDFQGGAGRGTAVTLTPGTGYFWFFNPANVEVVTKVLDGRGLNQSFWLFYGALSTVEYALTVTDTQTGLARRYVNPAGQLASVGDTDAFGPLGAHDTAPPRPGAARRQASARMVSARTDPRAATASCAASSSTLCLSGGRFAVTADWKDFQGHTGHATAVSLTGDTGYFWFFDPANVEVVTKVLDGRAVNSKFWLFYGALSSVEYTLTVTDTQTGAVKMYKNPSGTLGSLADTSAF